MFLRRVYSRSSRVYNIILIRQKGHLYLPNKNPVQRIADKRKLKSASHIHPPCLVQFIIIMSIVNSFVPGIFCFLYRIHEICQKQNFICILPSFSVFSQGKKNPRLYLRYIDSFVVSSGPFVQKYKIASFNQISWNSQESKIIIVNQKIQKPG